WSGARSASARARSATPTRPTAAASPACSSERQRMKRRARSRVATSDWCAPLDGVCFELIWGSPSMGHRVRRDVDGEPHGGLALVGGIVVHAGVFDAVPDVTVEGVEDGHAPTLQDCEDARRPAVV